MMKLYYGGQYFMRRSGRRSPGSFGALQSAMPPPDSVHVSENQPAAYAWTLDTWEKVAQTRGTNQREDMLAAIAELRGEEAEARKQYRRTWGTPEWKRSHDTR